MNREAWWVSPQGHKVLDMIEHAHPLLHHTHTHTHTKCHTVCLLYTYICISIYMIRLIDSVHYLYIYIENSIDDSDVFAYSDGQNLKNSPYLLFSLLRSQFIKMLSLQHSDIICYIEIRIANKKSNRYWCMLKSLSCVRLFVTPWSTQPASLLCPWDSQARILDWLAMTSSRRSSRPRDRTHIFSISYIDRQVLYYQCHLAESR